jgi:hypothetical protein
MDIFKIDSATSNATSNLGVEIVKLVGFIPTVIKIAVLVMSLFYLFFAFILTRRVKIMTTNFKTPLAPVFSLVALGNLIASLVVIAITLLTLIK